MTSTIKCKYLSCTSDPARNSAILVTSPGFQYVLNNCRPSSNGGGFSHFCVVIAMLVFGLADNGALRGQRTCCFNVVSACFTHQSLVIFSRERVPPLSQSTIILRLCIPLRHAEDGKDKNSDLTKLLALFI